MAMACLGAGGAFTPETEGADEPSVQGTSPIKPSTTGNTTPPIDNAKEKTGPEA